MPAAVRSSQDLDQHVSRALRTGGLAELDLLAQEVDDAASAAREAALRAGERARLSTADAVTARDEQDDAAYLWDTLTALLQRLRERRRELLNEITLT
jgi:hypothetical protein